MTESEKEKKKLENPEAAFEIPKDAIDVLEEAAETAKKDTKLDKGQKQAIQKKSISKARGAIMSNIKPFLDIGLGYINPKIQEKGVKPITKQELIELIEKTIEVVVEFTMSDKLAKGVSIANKINEVAPNISKIFSKLMPLIAKAWEIIFPRLQQYQKHKKEKTTGPENPRYEA